MTKTKTKTLKTKTKTLTIAKARKAAEALVEMHDADFAYGCYSDTTLAKVKADFRSALGLPEDFRLTDKRMNDISDDLMSVHDSFTAYGQRISVALLADTLYTLAWPTAYAMPLKTAIILNRLPRARG